MPLPAFDAAVSDSGSAIRCHCLPSSALDVVFRCLYSPAMLTSVLVDAAACWKQFDGTTSNLSDFFQIATFWADKPAVCFAQAESQFTLPHITSDATKVHYIVANFDSRCAVEVGGIITNPLKSRSTPMYEKLKKQLIDRLSLSKEQRVRKLLGREELDVNRPWGIFAR
ncbi:hypothetical protein TNIN_373091 [Trichonephila inaurata madagascariensis]|uniref:DUF7041 domain-containing protein n=1 Tax=Trichonephila inaurata madagascariensis TaxID=2747483 RepID=A0A8X6YEI6_9ARAC|nr:hypothetical protein TNIN_373091 [Trichonephila inaurata madagascariensis]